LSAQEAPQLSADDIAAAAAGASGDKPFSFGFNLGTDVLPIPGAVDGSVDNYQRFGFTPELALGKFGIGLDITLRAKIALGTDDPFQVYMPDWVWNYMGNGTTFFDVYLPKVLYLRYGRPGEDLYAKCGSIEDLSLGNGFIMGNYSNTRFLPQTRIFGLGASIDGDLFKFPYLGTEFAVGNLSQFDVFGGRVYVRPLAWLNLPIIKGLELGGEAAYDRQPDLYGGTIPAGAAPGTFVWGVDAKLPILGGSLFPMTAFADLSFQPNQKLGAMVGLSGRIIGILPYEAQVRVLKGGFIPTLFDANYDIYRFDRYTAMQSAANGDVMAGWYGRTGLDIMGGKLAFGAQVDGPFAPIPAAATDNNADYPHLRASLTTADGLLGGFSLSGSYDKYFLGISGDFWADLISAENAQIEAKLSYKTGAALISLLYNLRYDPILDSFDVSSSLQTSISY
jgi:hypothetical protein